MTRPSTPNILRATLALVLGAAVAACTTVPADTDPAPEPHEHTPAVHATRVFSFPPDAALDTGGLVSVHVWDWTP